MGTGSIANDMVQILKQLPDTEVIAVGSRSAEGAKRFGNRWGIPRQYGSYEEATSDKDVDVCYIATPSLRHPQDCLLAIENGKSVLCEKSMAPNHVVATEVLDAAKGSNLLFVHGVWSRFFPAMRKVREIIESGEIGTIRSARASFCQNDGAGSCSALLETGIYCAQFLQWALGDPGAAGSEDGTGPVVRGACQTLHESGNDEHVTAIIEFPGSKIGSFECSLAHCSSRSATIYGSGGVIDIPFPFWCPTQVKVTKMTGLGSQQWSVPEIHEFPLPSDIVALPTADGDVPGFNFVNSQGLAYEAEEVNRCFRSGLIESSSFSTQQCIEILRLISDIGQFAAN
eukprot:CAMPEP_0172554118 /NCGR_PEP_ID=MMETSP1067-20121228/53243_1 /TAXON_ID=265564 ORGANISM="Thalassiosira punctigera, Strain Tpunct2005C2" /NCGR_SAMPLE_ID=MMETSP1067 /ASSEMBLY_ACC=CAM_ASM_000444 /LENGTH=341 /DNA_ID=CAMNT_0013342427 /DNA_START=67 /DNA_END=1092 /DNA_ORIENTATION=+